MQFNQAEDDLIENHDINVTPFIDVMLVLLIIFMVVAPLATVTVPIELPASNEKVSENTPLPVVVSIAKDGRYLLAGQAITDADLPDKLKQALAEQEQQLVYIQADKHTDYEQLMQLMNLIRAQGISNIGLVAEQEKPHR